MAGVPGGAVAASKALATAVAGGLERCERKSHAVRDGSTCAPICLAFRPIGWSPAGSRQPSTGYGSTMRHGPRFATGGERTFIPRSAEIWYPFAS